MIKALAVGCAMAALGACSLTRQELVPLLGPAPYTVLVLPVTGTVEPEVARGLLAAVDRALRARGYYAVPVEVGLELLGVEGMAEHRPRPVEEYAAAARALGVDAFLTLRVERWYAIYAPRLLHLDHDIGYRLWSAASGELLWELRSRGRWGWDAGNEFIDHDSALAVFHGVAPRGEPFSPYRDSYDVARVLHRRALAQLPAGPAR